MQIKTMLITQCSIESKDFHSQDLKKMDESKVSKLILFLYFIYPLINKIFKKNKMNKIKSVNK